MRSAIVSFIMVVVMAGAVTAQEWSPVEKVDPITDLTSRIVFLSSERNFTTGSFSVLCLEESDGVRKAINVSSGREYRYKSGDNEITVRWDSDEPEIQKWKGIGENRNILSLEPAPAEFITNIVQKDRLVIRAVNLLGADVTYVFDIGNADTKEAMDWVMEKCNVGNAIDSTTSTDDTPATFYLTNQDMYVIGLVGLFVVGLIVARRYRNRPY